MWNLTVSLFTPNLVHGLKPKIIVNLLGQRLAVLDTAEKRGEIGYVYASKYYSLQQSNLQRRKC